MVISRKKKIKYVTRNKTINEDYISLLYSLHYDILNITIIFNPLAPSYIYTDAAERSPLFGKLINSKPKKIRQIFFISGKYTECRFTSTYFEQNITQAAVLNIDTLM